MKVVTQEIMRDLQFIEADLRDYVNDPAEYRITYIEDVYTLVSRVLKDLNIEPLRSQEENIDIDLDGGLSAATNEQEKKC